MGTARSRFSILEEFVAADGCLLGLVLRSCKNMAEFVSSLAVGGVVHFVWVLRPEMAYLMNGRNVWSP